MSLHQALDSIFKLDETTVGCIRDIIWQRNCLDRFSQVSWVIPSFVVIEDDHKRFGLGAKDRYHDEGLFEQKQLSKEMGSEILPSLDGSREKTFKPIDSLITMGKLK
uniref:Uncharacterized protein n=1 Tax=Tanacetum cinerariifolium TaxID=118510 RepID=A0A699ISP5_TANCI|nr:hypothetical protein [Tanacetum cinerariifolium]